MTKMRSITLAVALAVSVPFSAAAVELKAGDRAPLFTARTHDGADFSLESRKGQWTVLYFYPKSGTPGCTRQACGFRDGIATIRAEGADVYGVSTDDVESQKKFHDEQRLSFTLLADPEGTVTEAYGAKMPLLTYAKRWTFIIDPTLTIRHVEHDVDPSEDAQRVAAEIARLKGTGGGTSQP
jgi:peroxiredoxin Q/BCP